MSETASDLKAKAIAIAMGNAMADPAAAGTSVRAAHKDLNGKGRGPWWHRMVYRKGEWTYFSDERLPSGTFLASDRRATVYGDVFLGELVCQHDKGGKADAMWLVCEPNGEGHVMNSVEFTKRRDGRLAVTLPDGQVVVVPNPRE